MARQGITWTPTAQDRHLVHISPDVLLATAIVGALVCIPFLGKLGALIFLGAGVILCARHWRQSLLACLKYWPVICLPVFCLASFAWSQYPALSMRFGLQFLVTAVIAVVLATRVGPRIFCQLLFGFFLASMIASILFGHVRSDTGAWVGLYGSKNALAGAAAIFVIISMSLALDGAAPRLIRFVACFGFVLGAIPLLLAQSISALAVVSSAVTLQAGILITWRLTSMQRAVALVGILLLSTMVVVLVAIHFQTLTGLLLETTGKDVTLTGRTDLWAVALAFVAERPLLGVGYQAFWVRGNMPAEMLWAEFGIDARAGFNFHNMYLSNAVEIGIVGVALQVFVLYGAAVLTGLWALKSHRADAALLFVMVIVVIFVSPVEVPVFFQFSLRTVLVISAFIYGAQALRQMRRTLTLHAPAKRPQNMHAPSARPQSLLGQSHVR